MKTQFQSYSFHGFASGKRIASLNTRLRRAAVLSLLAGGLAITPGCGRDDAKTSNEAPRVVRAFTVSGGEHKADFSRRFTGVIRARTESALGFRVAGKVAERLVNAGETVKVGQPLLRLDPSDYRLALQAARAVQKQASLELDRVRVLVEKGAESRDALERASALAESSAAQADQLENQERYTTLYADAEGVVMSTMAEPGQVVGAGQPVLVLAKDGRREAAVDIPEGSVESLRRGTATAQLYFNADLKVPATLREVSGVADPVARTYQARYVLEGDASRFPLGATVTVRITSVEEGASTYEIPLGSLNDRGDGPSVWVIDPRSSALSKRAVTIAKLGAETALVSQGLNADEVVVALGAQLLHAGEIVRVVKAPVKEVK